MLYTGARPRRYAVLTDPGARRTSLGTASPGQPGTILPPPRRRSMLRAMFQALLRGSRRRLANASRPNRFTPAVRPLEAREVPAVVALFVPAGGGSLTVFGDAADNAITISRNAAGN